MQEWLNITSSPQFWAEEMENELQKSTKSHGETLEVPQASIWENFDINKVTNESYMQPVKADEVLLVEIEEDDIRIEVEYWKNAIICYYVLGAHPLLMY